ncbi:MAG: cytochrome d ubiquinol oxidase subunit II [Muribaculaceae bacterium]|nr:cytochrome d ubiquinol oxidase subunit II [Muribaculaceae bacterium]
MTLSLLQSYWWLLISILGALLVFLLFVQGGQTLILFQKNNMARQMTVNSLGRKWELTFTTLVVFGGAFFASFPLFYSTSFGGAYWLWMLILVSFVIQAFSYEFRRKPGNLLGTRFYDLLLFLNGIFGCVLLGVAVGTMFFGADFVVEKGNIVNGASPVISSWKSPLHGLEAIFSFPCLLLGFTVLYLARMQASFYLLNNLSGDAVVTSHYRRTMVLNSGIFLVLFLTFLAVLFTAVGYEYSADGTVTAVQYKYLMNLVEMWWFGALFLIGVVLVLYAIFAAIFKPGKNNGIWFTGIGTFLVILSLFAILGYNNTCYYPSVADINSSLNIANSSSTHFTLEVMAYVSLFIPVVILYIWYVWRKMDSKPITPQEVLEDDHLY